MNQDLNTLAAEVHQANLKWWQNPKTGEPIQRNRYELLALVVSEISECLEGERKNCMDDKLSHRKMAEVELADAKIRLLDFAAGFNLDIIYFTNTAPVAENKGEALFGIIENLASSTALGFRVAYAIAQIEAYAKKWGYDVAGAFAEKMAYNATREDHKHEARKIAGGKQF